MNTSLNITKLLNTALKRVMAVDPELNHLKSQTEEVDFHYEGPQGNRFMLFHHIINKIFHINLNTGF